MRARSTIERDYKRTTTAQEHEIVCRELMVELLCDIRDTLLGPNPIELPVRPQKPCADPGCKLKSGEYGHVHMRVPE